MELRVKHGSLLWFGKVLLSGVLAFITLTLFCMWYYNVPVHDVCLDGVTDYTPTGNTFWSQALEGFSYGYTNNEGYRNMFDYNPSMNIDILIMGSSQMDASCVKASESTADRLNAAFTDRTVYNIGMAGHYFLTCAQNLTAAVNKYTPASAVVIQIASLDYSDEDISKVMVGEYPEIPSHANGIIGLLQKNQYLRRLYHQLKGMLGQADDEDMAAVPADTLAQAMTAENSSFLSALLSRMADTVASSGARLIIAYHPGTALNKDGSITFSTTQAEEDAFADLCEENGVLFLDMRDRFQKEYDENHVLPYGFSNTSVGSGHLNRDGHRMMAEELYAMMREAGL